MSLKGMQMMNENMKVKMMVMRALLVCYAAGTHGFRVRLRQCMLIIMKWHVILLPMALHISLMSSPH
jgi:hypothetical protein